MKPQKEIITKAKMIAVVESLDMQECIEKNAEHIHEIYPQKHYRYFKGQEPDLIECEEQQANQLMIGLELEDYYVETYDGNKKDSLENIEIRIHLNENRVEWYPLESQYLQRKCMKSEEYTKAYLRTFNYRTKNEVNIKTLAQLRDLLVVLKHEFNELGRWVDNFKHEAVQESISSQMKKEWYQESLAEMKREEQYG